MDLVLKFSLFPHTSKTAYFDDIVAQALNLLQVGVLAKFIQEKADGLVMGEGFFCGDRAGVFFVGGALAAIGPAAVKLAEAEGLGAHGLSVAIRLNIPRG